MTAAGGPDSLDPETLARLPQSLADGEVILRRIPPVVRLELRRQWFAVGALGALLGGAFWNFIILDMFWHRMPEALLWWQFYLFDAPGILILAWALSRLFRKAEIEVHPRGLRIVRSGLFGSRRDVWTDQELKDIRCRDTEVTVNDAPQYELEIELGTGKKVHLLRGISRAALEAIAAELRDVLWARRARYPASS